MEDDSRIRVDTGQEEDSKASETEKTEEANKTSSQAADQDHKEEKANPETDSSPKAEEPENNKDKDKKNFFRKKDKEKEAMQEKIDSLQDQVKRQMAEFDNYRKRTDREKEQMFSNGESSVLEKILPIVDNFERGFDTVSEEEKDDAFVQGMHKVYDQLVKLLGELGVTEIDAEGRDFDPNYHNAVMQVESDQYESGKVAQVLQKGYMYHDKVLRHSMVSVVK